MTDVELLDLIKEILRPRSLEVSFEDLLVNLGWDSLASLEFVALADQKYGLKVSGKMLAVAITVGDLRETLVS